MAFIKPPVPKKRKLTFVAKSVQNASAFAACTLTCLLVRRRLRTEARCGPFRRNREDAPRRTTWGAGYDCAYQRVDSELRKLTHAGAGRRVDCRNDRRRLRRSGSLGGSEGRDAQRSAA